ncbi:MAG TPA: low affinity iron permease family protein [Candidatus Limnocylindrales bacterium]|jgi:low affinity Fe/Cu permease
MQAGTASSRRDRFNRIADSITAALGSVAALVGSVVLVVVWALTGPIFNFSDTWQLLINTTTTVITFWMVFVIQNSANRSAKATQLKLDEVIRALENARNEFISLDKAPEATLAKTEEEFDELVEGEPQSPPIAAPAIGPKDRRPRRPREPRAHVPCAPRGTRRTEHRPGV